MQPWRIALGRCIIRFRADALYGLYELLLDSSCCPVYA